MNSQLQSLSTKVTVPLYLCLMESSRMIAFHEGKIYESEIPRWLINFIMGDTVTLHFEQDSRHLHYFKWNLKNKEFIIFLDDPTLTTLLAILNFFAESSINNIKNSKVYKELELSKELIQKLKCELEEEKKKHTQDIVDMDQMKEIIVDLREQNVDQAARIKQLSADNNENTNIKTSIELENQLITLKKENAFLNKKINELENKSKNSFSGSYYLPGKLIDTPINTSIPLTNPMDEIPRNLKKVVEALSKVVNENDLSDVDFDIIGEVIPVPAKNEIENKPEQVRNIIIKLIGMERSGRLSAFQIQKLNEAVKH